MSMTKRDFRLLADALRSSYPTTIFDEEYEQWQEDVFAICNTLLAEYTHFDREKFLALCSGEQL